MADQEWKPREERGPNLRDVKSYFALTQVPIEVLVVIGIGFGADYLFDSRPWGTVIGAIVGLAVGFLHMISLLVQISKDQQDQKS